MLEVALVLLGILLTTTVVGGFVIKYVWKQNLSLKSDFAALQTALDGVVKVQNANFKSINEAITAVNDRVGKIQTVGFLSKRVQPQSEVDV